MPLKYSEMHPSSDTFLGMHSQLLLCLHIILTSSVLFLFFFPLQIYLWLRCHFILVASTAG